VPSAISMCRVPATWYWKWGASQSSVPENHLVALSAGPTPLPEYLWQLAADHLVHAWDLATAIGTDLVFEDGLAAAVEQWFVAREDGYRQAGAIGPRAAVPDGADRQQRLLAAFGRRAADGSVGREPSRVS